MSRKYQFYQEEFTTLNALGESYARHFSKGLEDIFTRTKELIKFIKSINRKLAKEIVSVLTSCKYQNTALTLVIFKLCDHHPVIINGTPLTFEQFVKLLVKKEETEALYAFMEDLGISKTYATLNIEPHLESDAYFIERNIHDPFVFEYLTTYYEFDYTESLQSKISNVFIYDEERFRRGVKVIRDDRFQLLLAHKVGFKDVYKMRNMEMPLFEAVRLLRCEFDEKDLSRLVLDTFYWWLLDNFDKYVYKKQAKKIKTRLQKLVKEKRKMDKKPNFNTLVDLSEQLFAVYIEFVDLMKKELILVKKKYDVSQYVLDKAYCRTYICLDYMKNNTVKLPKENMQEEKMEEDSVTEENYTVVKEELSDKSVNRQEKLILKLRRFSGFVIFFSLLSLLLCAGMKIMEVVLKEGGSYTPPKDVISNGWIVVFGALTVFNIALCIFLKILGNKTSRILNEYAYISTLRTKGVELSVAQEKKLESFKEKEAYYKRESMNSHRILTWLIAFIFGFTASVFSVYLISLVASFVHLPMDWNTVYLANEKKMLYLSVGSLFGLLYGLLRKRKGAFTAILLFLVALAGVVVLGFVMR